MTPAERPERARDPFDDSVNFRAHADSLDTVMRQADELIARGNAGLLTERERQSLPRRVMRLRQLLSTQLAQNGRISQTDRSDGSYDDATTDDLLRQQVDALRDMDIDHNRMWGTRTVRKIGSWLTEGVPNWFNVKTGQVWDNLKQFLKVVGVAGALTAGGYAAYGHLAGGGAMAGLGLMGEHAGRAGGAIGNGFGWLRRRVFG